ncbi:hypothetical protein BaRGS_00006923 [Batillaria attramentaria]|uniref:G-protein coupled receptors family 1 profile domain-containing protein n=1 Tax=Batillaria attramentaria TaxID=370345 RepID=A0ABD0LS36_9CAEN
MASPTTVTLSPEVNVTSDPQASSEEDGDRVSPEEKLVVVCMLSVLCIFGLCGNGLVLYVFSSKGNKVTSTIFILALAWTDFITCVAVIPFTIASVAVDSHLRYDFVCKAYNFLITCSVPLSAFIMVAIAVDRYFSICHPFLHAVTPKRARFTVIVLCFVAFVFGTITCLSHGIVGGVGEVANPVNETSMRNYSLSNASVGIDTSTLSPSVTECAANCTGSANSDAADAFSEAGGICYADDVLISREFLTTYRLVYASTYLISLLTVFVIYALIYRSVVKRREWRRRQRSGKPIKASTTIATEVEELELRTKNGAVNGNGSETQSLNSSDKKASAERRDFNFLANIRTAFMLFIVTLVFIVSFLPAWLMAVELINFNIIIFYMYFVYNVANPVIYAFMNHAFRKELKRVFQRGLHLFSRG